MINTAIKWAFWSTYWLSEKVLSLIAACLLFVGHALVRAGAYVSINLVPLYAVLVETERPGYAPPTMEQQEKIRSLHRQYKIYLEQSDEVFAALDATRDEIRYYEREYGIHRR